MGFKPMTFRTFFFPDGYKHLVTPMGFKPMTFRTFFFPDGYKQLVTPLESK